MKKSPQKQIELLDSLEKHEGWLLLMEEARREVALATSQLALARSLPQSELDWRRGMIASALLILEMPSRLKERIKSDAALAAAVSSSAPATAGAKKGKA